MDFIFASEVSRTVNASLTNGGVSCPLQSLDVAIIISPVSHRQQCHGCGAGSISSREDSARDTDSNEDIMQTDVAEVRATYQQQGSPETALASAADAISEAEDEARNHYNAAAIH